MGAKGIGIATAGLLMVRGTVGHDLVWRPQALPNVVRR